jgi:alpha-acetolactate decarboxylase
LIITIKLYKNLKMHKKIALGSFISLVLIVSLFSSLSCKPAAESRVCVPTTDTQYVLVFNCVDELLTGDLADTVSLSDIAGPYAGKDIVGLGTTLRQHNGELLFMDGKCYWADPTSDGKVTEIEWTDEPLPFCAITRLSGEDSLVFNGVTGDIHEWLVNKLVELSIPLAAIKVNGNFADVDFSIADKLPTNPTEILKSALVTVTEEQEWQMVGFYASNSDDQAVISVPESPVHLHGKTLGDSHGGHIKKANSISSTVTIYPIREIILRNKVLAGVPAEQVK